MRTGSARMLPDARPLLSPMDISSGVSKHSVYATEIDAMREIVRTVMEVDNIYKIVGAVVLGLLGYVIFGFLAGIAGAVVGIFLGPVAIKKFLNAR
jgi:hypothetical protein